jgi:hypothetical protein
VQTVTPYSTTENLRIDSTARSHQQAHIQTMASQSVKIHTQKYVGVKKINPLTVVNPRYNLRRKKQIVGSAKNICGGFFFK